MFGISSLQKKICVLRKTNTTPKSAYLEHTLSYI